MAESPGAGAPKLSLVDMMGKKAAPSKLPAKSAGKATPSAAQKVVAQHFRPREGVLEGGQLYWVDVNLIDDNPFQPRSFMDEAELSEFYDDINTNGQSTPGLARPYSAKEIKQNPELANRYQLAFAHRRKECVRRGANAAPPETPDREKYAGKLLIYIRTLTDEQMVSEAIRENEKRADVTLLDRARSYVKLREQTTIVLVAQGQATPYTGDIKPGDENEYFTIGGQTYKAAPWRTVTQRNGGNFNDMQRIANTLRLPKEWLKDFEPDPKDPLKFVFNSLHSRVLFKLRHAPDLQLSTYNAIKKKRLSAADAERHADQVRAGRPTQLDLDIKEAAKKQAQEQGKQSRKTAAEKNSQALVSGKSHLTAIPASPGAPDASTQNETKGVAAVGGAWYRAESVLEELNDVLAQVKVKGTEEIAEDRFRKLAQKKAAFDKLWSDLVFEIKKLGPNR